MRSTVSPVTDDKTNKHAPTGGVISEMFRARMKIIPACIGSRPMLAVSGVRTGANRIRTVSYTHLTLPTKA